MKGERGSNTMNITDVRVRKIEKEGKMKAMFVSKGHTPIMVPLFAYGPQSKLFGGVQENSDVSNKILQLLAK